MRSCDHMFIAVCLCLLFSGVAARRFHTVWGVPRVALVMLLSFPLVRSQNFTNHFRVPEAARLIRGHTFFASLHAEAKLYLARSSNHPIPVIRSQSRIFKDNVEATVTARASIIEMLHRLKVGPHSESDSESIV